MLGVTEDRHSGALKELKVTMGVWVATDIWGCQGCLGSRQTLEVEVIVGGQCYSRCSGSWWSLGVSVDIHGQGNCSVWEQQAESAWMEKTKNKKTPLHLAQAVTSRYVSGCPSIMVQGRLFRGRDSGLQQAGCTNHAGLTSCLPSDHEADRKGQEQLLLPPVCGHPHCTLLPSVSP